MNKTPTVIRARALLKAASPWPWKWWTSNSWRRLSSGDKDGNVLCPIVARDGHPDLAIKDEDAALIEQAPMLIHTLCVEVEELMKIVADLRGE